MYSRGHALTGGAASLMLVVGLFPGAAPTVQAGLWAYGVALSVLVDLDHFIVARITVGDWRNLRRLLDDPVGTLADQSRLFDEDHLTELQRLLSHVLLAGPLVVAAWVLAEPLGEFTVGVLYVHLLADLLRDNGIV